MITKERHGPWALLVGGSEGIGEELAGKLAALGINLVLVARKPDVLEQTARKVQNRHGVEVRALSLDASRDDLLERIREQIQNVE